MNIISAASSQILRQTGLSPSQKEQVWSNQLEKLLGPLISTQNEPGAFGKKRIDAVRSFVSDKIQQWLGQNPNASESQIAEKAEAFFRTGYGHQLCWKSIDDALFSKMLDSLKREVERD